MNAKTSNVRPQQVLRPVCISMSWCLAALIAIPLFGFSQGEPDAGKKQTKKPNVVFICVDDLRPELGCYGATYIKSPNIDRLAADGVIFTNHFVTVPTCGASRFGMLTGMLPRTRGELQDTV